MKRSIVGAVLVLAVMFVTALLPLRVGAQTALQAADLVFRETEAMVRQYADEMRQAQKLDEFADKARDRIAKSRTKFTEAARLLDQEIARLNTNPDKNAVLIKNLNDIKAKSDGAREKLKGNRQPT